MRQLELKAKSGREHPLLEDDQIRIDTENTGEYNDIPPELVGGLIVLTVEGVDSDEEKLVGRKSWMVGDFQK